MQENILEKPIIKVKTLKQLLVIVTFTALTIALPLLAHQYHLAGPIFLPMHFFVLAAGLIFGWKTGLVVGAISPIVSFGLSGMPPIALIPLMTLEIAAYGFFAGLLKEKGINTFTAIILAMVLGRVVLFFGVWVLLSTSPTVYFFQALKLGIVGITLQLALIPFLVRLVRKYIKA